MKKIILILMISMSLVNYSKSMGQNQLESKDTKEKRSFRSKFTDTKVAAYCENGKAIYKGSFKNGKKDGEWVTYYKAEKIKLKGNYKNGRKDGEWTTYYKDGEVKWKTNYKDGESIDDGTISKFGH
ncbi:toxin-antitoxin system YwqK family antitoxin [Psychrilyobacter atlanticus]|uniref:toxin-antitoxin system YwqK family antitoxin n=1 Tax=Psychrilyobacter atlanticus TaxID=271091 RepID=UPI0012EB721C|nr:hypothetical protein [Psychrilyobacter atlanticus]